MKRTDIQTTIRDTINDILVKQQDNADRSACKTYSHLARETSEKLERYQKKNEETHEKIIATLDNHIKSYIDDREHSRKNNEAIFTQLSELTTEIKKNSDFRLENVDSLEVIRDALSTIKTNKRWITWITGFFGSIAGIITSLVVIKEYFVK